MVMYSSLIFTFVHFLIASHVQSATLKDVDIGIQNHQNSLYEDAIVSRALNPDGYWVTAAVYYDSNWKTKFGANSEAKAKEMMTQVKNLFLKFGNSSINIEVVGYKYVNENWYWATGAGMEVIENKNLPNIVKTGTFDANLHVGVTGAVCKGPQGSGMVCYVCNEKPEKRVSISSWDTGKGMKGTAETVAHEIGHNLGFFHDHVTETPPVQKKINGKECKGIMSYNEPFTTYPWSECSVSDLVKCLAKNPCI